MKLRKISLAFFILISVFVFTDTHAQSSSSKHPVYVLVHGAWHGGWCWQRVSSELRAHGGIVYTPTLSGLGEHKHTLSNAINLDTHISDIVNLIEMEDLHDVILVGHSYAGTVIAGVADRIPERLSKLVFLDAMLVENGQSAFGVQSKEQQDFNTKEAAKDGGLTVPVWSAEIFGVTKPEDIKWVNARLTGHPFRTFTQKLSLQHPFGNHLPLIYIGCAAPMLKPIVPFAEKAKNSKDWKYYEIATGHDAMITEPEKTAAMLESVTK